MGQSNTMVMWQRTLMTYNETHVWLVLESGSQVSNIQCLPQNYSKIDMETHKKHKCYFKQ